MFPLELGISVLRNLCEDSSETGLRFLRPRLPLTVGTSSNSHLVTVHRQLRFGGPRAAHLNNLSPVVAITSLRTSRGVMRTAGVAFIRRLLCHMSTSLLFFPHYVLENLEKNRENRGYVIPAVWVMACTITDSQCLTQAL